MNDLGCGCALALPTTAGGYLAVVVIGMLAAGLFLVAAAASVVRALAAVAVFRALVWALTLCVLAGVLLAALAAAQVGSAAPRGDDGAPPIAHAAHTAHAEVVTPAAPLRPGAGSHEARRA